MTSRLTLTAALLVMATAGKAQWISPSYTMNSNVGIGVGPSLNARLQLKTISDPNSLLAPSAFNAIPGLVIQREYYINGSNPVSAPKNIMEVWRQQFSGSGSPFSPGLSALKFVIDADGNVGVNKSPVNLKTLDVGGDENVDGILTVGGPSSLPVPDQLTVTGNVTFMRSSDNDWRNLRARTNNSGLAIFSNTSGNDGAYIALNGKTNTTTATTGAGAITFGCYGTGGAPGFEFTNYDPATSSWNSRVRISADGRMAIGANTMPTPAGYGLYVENGVLASKVKVALPSDPTNWSDFVFDKDYKLPELSEVESYIADNKHLPGIPSTAEVHKEGLDLAQMDAKLLQKVEELTLYVIQLQKEIAVLKSGKAK